MFLLLILPILVQAYNPKALKEGLNQMEKMTDDWSIPLTSANFTSAVLESGDSWFISLCMPSARKWITNKPNWSMFAKKMQGHAVKVGTVNLQESLDLIPKFHLRVKNNNLLFFEDGWYYNYTGKS